MWSRDEEVSCRLHGLQGQVFLRARHLGASQRCDFITDHLLAEKAVLRPGPMQTKWVTDVRGQAPAASVTFHFKLWGESRPGEGSMGRPGQELAGRILDGTTWNEVPVSAA